ncbi:MAG: hypothetical protein V4629_03350 [Pseudomonadota bacterium]
MKTTDMSKLHLAKRVYLRNGNIREIIHVSMNSGNEDFPICMTYQNAFKAEYKNNGQCGSKLSELDIIAFDIDEPLSNLERAHEIVESWPEWKKNIRLTANSPERNATVQIDKMLLKSLLHDLVFYSPDRKNDEHVMAAYKLLEN